MTTHGLLLGLLLVGNAIGFAGIDPVARLVTAGLAVALAASLPRAPDIPKLHRWAGWVVVAVVVMQLVPLPLAARQALMPGLAELLRPGWSTLSVAPWSTIQVAASMAVVTCIAVTASRMAVTRSGLPLLVWHVATTGAVVAVLGLISEASNPAKVLLFRANTGGGGPYGPFVNNNHFALAVELTLPAAVVLLAAGCRQLSRPGLARQRALVVCLATAVIAAVDIAALLRCGSRGGVFFTIAGGVLSVPFWWRPRVRRLWPGAVFAGVVLTVAVAMAWVRLPELKDHMSRLLVIEGVESNSRWDLWQATLALWGRAPLPGIGIGGYRYAVGLDKPATEARVLEHAHNDWLEWLATAGAGGALVVVLGTAGMVALLWLPRVRRLRFEYRYPMAGAVFAVSAAALHELVGFGLQIPLNRYLVATWIGLVWGVATLTSRSRRAIREDRAQDDT